MITQDLNAQGQCCCGPAPQMSETEACAVCAPKTVLTADEEAILSRLRELKSEARSIAERMKRINVDTSITNEDKSSDNGSELAGLEWQLSELRSAWGVWQQRLDEAIDRKLILLGHRAPHN